MPRMTHVDCRIGKCLKSPALSLNSAAQPVLTCLGASCLALAVGWGGSGVSWGDAFAGGRASCAVGIRVCALARESTTEPDNRITTAAVTRFINRHSYHP